MPWDWRSPGLPKLHFGDILIMDDLPIDTLPLMDAEQSEMIARLLQQTSDLRCLAAAYSELDRALTESIHEFRQLIGFDESRQVVAVIDDSPYAIGIRGNYEDDDYKVLAYRLPLMPIAI
jgi:hypothetical protein